MSRPMDEHEYHPSHLRIITIIENYGAFTEKSRAAKLNKTHSTCSAHEIVSKHNFDLKLYIKSSLIA